MGQVARARGRLVLHNAHIPIMRLTARVCVVTMLTAADAKRLPALRILFHEGKVLEMLHGSIPPVLMPLRVLIIDGDASRGRSLTSALPNGSVVDVVPSSATALSMLDSSKPDIVVLDVAQSDTDGVRLIRQIREQLTPEGSLIMVVTALSSLPMKIAAMEAGADDFLVRPVTPGHFHQQVRLLGKFKQLEATRATDESA
jgi:PleD family two-component response regulator